MAQQSDQGTVEIIEHCRRLGFVKSELSGGVLVEIPAWTAFKQTLPAVGAQREVKAFHVIADYFEARTRVRKGQGRWQLWHTGTTGVHSSL